MENIRLATPEEVESIRDKSDLEVGSTVYAFGKSLAVLRTQTRLDPVIFDPEAQTQRRYQFIWGLETAMRLSGVPAYYFNVPTEDATWIRAVEHNGAQRIHDTAMLEYKKLL